MPDHLIGADAPPSFAAIPPVIPPGEPGDDPPPDPGFYELRDGICVACLEPQRVPLHRLANYVCPRCRSQAAFHRPPGQDGGELFGNATPRVLTPDTEARLLTEMERLGRSIPIRPPAGAPNQEVDEYLARLNEVEDPFGWWAGEVNSYAPLRHLVPADEVVSAERRFAADLLERAANVGLAVAVALADRHGELTGPEPFRIRLHSHRWRLELHRSIRTLSGMGDGERERFLRTMYEEVRALLIRARCEQAGHPVPDERHPSNTTSSSDQRLDVPTVVGAPSRSHQPATTRAVSSRVDAGVATPTDVPPDVVEHPANDQVDVPEVTDTTPNPADRRSVPQEVTDEAVLRYLTAHAPKNQTGIRRDDIATAIGSSTGAVSKSPAWKAYAKHRKATIKPKVRTVHLRDEMLAVLPDGSDISPEIAELIEDQAAVMAEDESFPERRS